MDQPPCPMPTMPVPMEGSGPTTLPSAEEMGSVFASLPVEASGARGFRYDAWASYVPPPLSIDKFRESNDNAKVLNVAVENCDGHVTTLAKHNNDFGDSQGQYGVMSVAVSVHTLQCQSLNWSLTVSLCMVTLAKSTWPLMSMT